MSRYCGRCQFFDYYKQHKFEGYSSWGVCKLTPERGTSQIKSEDDWCGQFKIDEAKKNNEISKAVSNAFAEVSAPRLFRIKRTVSRYIGFSNLPLLIVTFLALGSVKFAVDLLKSILGLFH